MTEKEEESEEWLREEFKEIEKYLKNHKVVVSRTEIVRAAIKLTRRLGAGDYTFVCYFRQEERRRKEGKEE